MKFKVTYYDVDTDSTITKNCDRSYNSNGDKSFSFYPVDNPPKSYKAVIIDKPTISIYQNSEGIKIVVEGYQYIKSSGYWKTQTIIESENSSS